MPLENGRSSQWLVGTQRGGERQVGWVGGISLDAGAMDFSLVSVGPRKSQRGRARAGVAARDLQGWLTKGLSSAAAWFVQSSPPTRDGALLLLASCFLLLQRRATKLLC